MRVFLVHIMKTGGTSVTRLLREHVSDDAVYPSRKHEEWVKAKLTPSDLLSLPPERREAVELYSVHMPAWVTERVDPSFLMVTVLREPVARTISHLRQIAGLAWTPDDLDEIWDDPRWRLRLTDYQTRVLGSEEADDRLTAEERAALERELTSSEAAQAEFRAQLDAYHGTAVRTARPLPAGAHRRALERLEAFDIVGVTEDLARATERLGTRLDLDLGPVRKTNVGDGRATASPELLRRIRGDLEHDMEIYERACELAGSVRS